MLSSLKKEYDELWKSCVVSDNNLPYVTWATNICISHKPRYEEIAAKAMCPWYLVGILHCTQSRFDFSSHYYNGDPLSDRTVNYPAGKPTDGMPPFSWEQSALSALRDFGAGNIVVWDVAHVLYFCESVHQFNYRDGYGKEVTPPYRSPYLWAMTNHYIKGRFHDDGKFDPNSVYSSVGVAAVLKMIESRGMMPTEEQVAPLNPFESSKKPTLQNQVLQLNYHLSLLIKDGEFARWIKENYELLPTTARKELAQCQTLLKMLPPM